MSKNILTINITQERTKKRQNTMNAQNPLLQKSTAPNFSPEFDKIKAEHFEPAITAAIQIGQKHIEAIKNNPDPATFENTI